jgi:two-component system, chemotaxis family, CheB/CheR fusion protein
MLKKTSKRSSNALDLTKSTSASVDTDISDKPNSDGPNAPKPDAPNPNSDRANSSEHEATENTLNQSNIDDINLHNDSSVEIIDFPIVGIGASAGGLSAFLDFFSGIPPTLQPDMAFVLVQHLAPDHQSMLTELIQRATHLKVYEVTDDMPVEINCVYIIPPNRDMSLVNGKLKLLEPSAPRGHRLPIDYLFNSLAIHQKERAIGIVLSGTGSDGTAGVRTIKNEGGMVMTQSVDTSEFDGMPSSAVATELVDYELPPAEMPAQLMAYVAHIARRTQKQLGDSGEMTRINDDALKTIFALLRKQTGHDFSQYKPSTLCRRIERRMAVRQLDTVERYIQYLQKSSAEITSLFQDLLIGVTHFFRDAETFSIFEQKIVPRLFDGKAEGAAVRVWCAGCSSGEEAYSIAILLYEHRRKLKRNFKIQVFATDIDARAIANARAGIYPRATIERLPSDRRTDFFTLETEGNSYRVQKNIRELVIFSEHDLIKDPPFSKLDLISCRNLLIYMNSDLQKRVIAIFHYALNPQGMVLLGASETVGEFGNLFVNLERKAKVYQRNEDFQGAKRAALSRLLMPTATKQSTPSIGETPLGVSKKTATKKMTLREITEKALLNNFSPACALVNALGDILYLHGRTGLFLEPAAGEATINNILRMAREGLRRDLTINLHKVATTKEPRAVRNLRVKTNGHFALVNFRICCVDASSPSTLESPLFLVMLEEAEPAQYQPFTPTASNYSGAANPATKVDHNSALEKIAELNEELTAKDSYLRAANEELETSNEDLKFTNEELQSVNEELQSTNEELETSKEEMQSINEELSTVNAELQSAVNELTRANNDMNNLLSGTGIATIFVDKDLNLLRFTPTVTEIINLIHTDVGRPVGHIVSNLVGYDQLMQDIKTVLKTLMPKEIDVKTLADNWYTMRILPYRTLDNVVEGVVITFVNITEVVRIREALRKANEQVLAQAKLKIYTTSHKL